MDTEELLSPREVNGDINIEVKPYSAKYYTLPGLRFGNVIRTILFIDAVFSLALWVTGGHSKYFIDSIIDFHFKESAFDVALLSAFRTVILFYLYTKLEDVSLDQTNRPYDKKISDRKMILHISCIFVSLFSFSYVVVKGGLILDAFLNNPNYTKMHLTFNILMISAPIFGLMELLFALGSFKAMRKLKVQRILHRLDEEGREVDEEGKVISKKVNFKRLMGLAKPESGMLLLATLFLLVSSASNSAAPLFFGMVVDAAQKSMDDLNRTIVILLLIYCVGAIAGMFRSWLFTLAGQRLVARLRKDLFNSIIKQDIAFFDTNRTGELTNRLSSDTQVLQNAVTVNISMLSRYLLQIIGSLTLMFVLNASLTGVLLAVVPIVSLGAVQYGKWLKTLRQNFQDRLADASTTAEESLSSIRTVRSFVGEQKASGTYGRDIDASYQVGKKMALMQGLFEGIIGMVSYGAISLVLWYGGKLVNEGHVTPGLLTSFLLYTLQVAMAFGLLSSLYGDFMQALGASIRIFDLLDKCPDIPVKGDIDRPATNLDEGITFYNVGFTYPSRPETKVLKGVSFDVSKGEMVALVGPSGGGKSTIVNLIERFYDPEKGYIALGGADLKDLDPTSFRRKIAMVSQEPTLFACSIKDNIAYGKESSMEEVIEAAKQANAHEFILSFEEGYDTLVGERGVRLSGGQKQRVAIARALIMNPAILLLDEATSALDAESEHLVQDAIDKAMKNRTVVVIAHRLSTVRNASKVVVIAKGTIAEQGTHDELISKGGVYKKLVLRQLTAGGGGVETMPQANEEVQSQENQDL